MTGPRTLGTPRAFGGPSPELPGRIKGLRLVRRWDQATLGQHAGISATLVSQIETGKVMPPPGHLDSIAVALGYSPDFLVADLKLAPGTRPWLRAYADASRREADARTAAVTLAVEYVRRLGLSPIVDVVPQFDGDLADDEQIDDAAVDARVAAGLSPDDVITNAVRSAERLGCVVLPLESEMGRHMGMSMRSDNIPMICVAGHGVPGDRQRFTVAHELGHLILHGQSPPPKDADEANRMEKQANRFAASFLGPGDPLIETLTDHGGRVTLRALAEVKAVWGISIKALVGRFKALGVIDEDQARSLYKQISARRWSKTEPVDVPLESAQWLHRTMLQKSSAATLDEAARVLAERVGGNAQDLTAFARWDPPTQRPNLALVR